MKRIISLIICVLMAGGVLTVLAACNNNGDDAERTPNQFETNPIRDVNVDGDGEELDLSIPEGWVRIAELDDDDNVQVLGLIDLFTREGSIVTIDDRSVLEVNYGTGLTGEEEILSVSLEDDDREFPVNVMEDRDVHVLYARGRIAGGPDDPTTIDIGTIPTIHAMPGTTAAAAVTTRPAATQTLGNVASVATTRAPGPTTTSVMQSARDDILNSDMSQEERQRAFRMLSYRLDENGVFYTERDPWQKQFGFNALFDMASPFLQLVYGTIRVNFRYGYVFSLYQDGPNRGQVRRDANNNPILETDAQGRPIPKDWLMQFWKGRYGLVLLGAEIGIYTKPSTQAAQHFFSAVEEEYIIFQISVWQHNFQTNRSQYLFTRGPHATWWITGFVPGSFHSTNANNRGKDEIITTGVLTFPSAQMMELVAEQMLRGGFVRGTPTHTSTERLSTSGTSIRFSWQFLDQDVPSRRVGSQEFYRLRG